MIIAKKQHKLSAILPIDFLPVILYNRYCSRIILYIVVSTRAQHNIL